MFSGTKYNVNVVTKTSFNEVDSAQVHVILHGEKGDSSKRVLIKPTEEKEKLFQKGTVRHIFFGQPLASNVFLKFSLLFLF